MKILLDEDVPEPLAQALAKIIPPHEVHSVASLQWNSKKDQFLFADARRRKFDVLITVDRRQLLDPAYCKQLQATGLHHVLFTQSVQGVKSMAFAMAAVFAAIHEVMSTLEDADGQRLIAVTAIAPGSRITVVDPRLDPPTYWPRTRQPGRPRAPRRPKKA